MPPKKNGETVEPPAWTDSDRATLREMIEERDFEKQLDARKARVAATIKTTIQWVVAVAGGLVILKDYALGALKWAWHLITGGQ